VKKGGGEGKEGREVRKGSEAFPSWSDFENRKYYNAFTYF